jgi:hypothetical protein
VTCTAPRYNTRPIITYISYLSRTYSEYAVSSGAILLFFKSLPVQSMLVVTVISSQRSHFGGKFPEPWQQLFLAAFKHWQLKHNI